jgi:cob(I)alamin adenosyltransferase
LKSRRIRYNGRVNGNKADAEAAADIEGHSEAAKFGQPRRLSSRGQRRLAALIRAGYREMSQPGVLLLAGHEAKRTVMNGAESLRRRAENLHVLAKKARNDNYTQLADYILDRADQLFEEARIREFDDTETE